MNLVWTTSSFGQLGKRELFEIVRLRQDVFIVEQACAYRDLDGLDESSVHMCGYEDGSLIAYQRLVPPGLSYPESSLGRILVAADGRGRSLGRDLVQRGIDYNRIHWPEHDICIGAQSRLTAFYESLGFVVNGKEYVEDGIPHVTMLLKITED